MRSKDKLKGNNMKHLILMLFLFGCAQTKEKNVKVVKPKPVTMAEKLSSCVDRLIERHGASPVVALDVCERIYRRNIKEKM